jgi:hypothetical protein
MRVLSPNTSVPSSDAGVFYPVAPDVSIVQVMFMEIPALHDAASDRSIQYTPVCESGPDGFQTCVHPAYRIYLSESEAALAPVVAEIAGLQGAPARAAEVADRTLPAYAAQGGYLAGNPAVYEFSYNYALSGTGQPPRKRWPWSIRPPCATARSGRSSLVTPTSSRATSRRRPAPSAMEPTWLAATGPAGWPSSLHRPSDASAARGTL